MILALFVVFLCVACLVAAAWLARCDSAGFGPDGPPRRERPRAGDTGPR